MMVFYLYYHIFNDQKLNSVSIFIIQEGSSALHIASRDGNEDIVESLLDHNADVTIQSNVKLSFCFPLLLGSSCS